MMRRLRSESWTRADLSKSQSPSRRRITRSQSREIEEDQPSQNEISSRGRNTRELSKALAPVVEESPSRTPQKPAGRYGRSVVIPDSPEDVANISGTTILPSEPESELDPEMMLEALPDLQRTGKSVLDFLAPTTASPVQIVNKAKLLSDPKNTQSRRLRRLLANLDRDVKLFSSDIYIDAAGIGRKFASVIAGKRGHFTDWSPIPIIQSANCARFALEVLLAGTSMNSQRQAIRSVERLFPTPFLLSLNEEGNRPGESALEKETFELALEIRKQSLILLLDDKQGDPDFNPKNAVKLCFFTGLSRQSPPRGFNLPSLGGLDGALPPRYRDTIQEVYNDILVSEQDGIFDVDELRASYLWKRFVLKAAHWLRRRTEEIHTELQTCASAQDVHDAYFASKHPSFASTLGGSEAEPVGVEPEATEQQQQPISEPSGAPVPAAQTDTERRRSSKPSYLNATSMQRILQRQERLRSGSETSDNRRQSDIALVSRAVNEQSDADRRQTISALPPSQPVQQAAPREILQSFEDASLTLIPDEPNVSIEDSQLAIGDDSTQIEQSHSPPTIRRRPAPWHRPHNNGLLPTTSQPAQASQQMESSQILALINERPFAQPAASPSRNPAARFIDRQQHAARISPISNSDSQGAVGRVEERVSRKRARQSTESISDGGSDIFDCDSRSVDVGSRRAKKPAETQSRSKRPRLEGLESRRDSNAVTQNNVIQDNVDPESPHPRRSRSSVLSPVPTTTKYKSTSKRLWTEAEDNRLIHLMREHGPSWSRLESQNLARAPQEGEVRLEGRDQVALKDRARNMKIACYREGRPIPEYLRPVGLKAADREKLRARGIVLLPEDDK
ncbi:uncharacterized protein BDV17DRAFT_209437 [Aspergillus undulatus]|uniref:uncharacterized protein n=1 Tax=Aspergillus undulatus TaxID=1810928 RepID=UPI003CCDB2D4